ncbi:MAG: polysaccharide pyruvyl transferase family protein [Armatimonadetes bacterium]|nr:polysaccharide pyruvyl transferase family protein [Armatimonadota bacterium]
MNTRGPEFRFRERFHQARHLATWATASALGYLRGNSLTAYWYTSEINFGDLVTPLLLKHYGFTPIHAQPSRASVVAAGSILESVPCEYAGVILGTGFQKEVSRAALPNATVLAVRGPLTLERLGRREGIALGDPGLLAPRLLPERAEKRFVLGVVPHYVHRRAQMWAGLIASGRGRVRLVDVQQSPAAVLRAIDECSHVVSSSLHGLITADALGIPTGWMSAPGLVGGRFKFDDYFHSLGLTNESPIELREKETSDRLVALTTLKPQERIAGLQESLHFLWSHLRDWIADEP